jgi:hypothetical protein
MKASARRNSAALNLRTLFSVNGIPNLIGPIISLLAKIGGVTREYSTLQISDLNCFL